jgi:hypothetical protein
MKTWKREQNQPSKRCVYYMYLKHSLYQTVSPQTQAVSRRLPNSAARIRSQVRSCGIFGGTGAGFLRVLRFPLLLLISPAALYLLIILSPTLLVLILTASLSNKREKGKDHSFSESAIVTHLSEKRTSCRRNLDKYTWIFDEVAPRWRVKHVLAHAGETMPDLCVDPVSCHRPRRKRAQFSCVSSDKVSRMLKPGWKYSLSALCLRQCYRWRKRSCICSIIIINCVKKCYDINNLQKVLEESLLKYCVQKMSRDRWGWGWWKNWNTTPLDAL